MGRGRPTWWCGWCCVSLTFLCIPSCACILGWISPGRLSEGHASKDAELKPFVCPLSRTIVLYSYCASGIGEALFNQAPLLTCFALPYLWGMYSCTISSIWNSLLSSLYPGCCLPLYFANAELVEVKVQIRTLGAHFAYDQECQVHLIDNMVYMFQVSTLIYCSTCFWSSRLWYFAYLSCLYVSSSRLWKATVIRMKKA